MVTESVKLLHDACISITDIEKIFTKVIGATYIQK